MKRLIVVLSAIFTYTSAYAVPTGCFVTSYGSYCYNGVFIASDCDQWNMNSYTFGNYISSMCSYINSTEMVNATLSRSLDGCQRAFSAVVAERNGCITERVGCFELLGQANAHRQELVAYSKKRDALIKKLYRACGVRCKKVSPNR